jgi:murein DD-endopeptidase MepM/ murein hydrolase activator NlpD
MLLYNARAPAETFTNNADVLAPFDGTVVYVRRETHENVPGVLGASSAAGSMHFKNGDGVIVVYAHVTEVAVKAGDQVKAGQVVAKLGNNGQTRAPGVHIGGYRRGGRDAAADTLGLTCYGKEASRSRRQVAALVIERHQ